MTDEKKSVNIEEAYRELTKKYKLPSYSLMNNEFEISTIDSPDFLLRNIRLKTQEKLEFAIKLLSSVFQPEQNPVDLQECTLFNEDHKKNMYVLFKNLMVFVRTANMLSFSSTEKQESEYLTNFFTEWTKKHGFREQLTNLLHVLRDSWGDAEQKSANLEYLG
jgi:hypothetical protein